jgi:hypothetical protein
LPPGADQVRCEDAAGADEGRAAGGGDDGDGRRQAQQRHGRCRHPHARPLQRRQVITAQVSIQSNMHIMTIVLLYQHR